MKNALKLFGAAGLALMFSISFVSTASAEGLKPTKKAGEGWYLGIGAGRSDYSDLNSQFGQVDADLAAARITSQTGGSTTDTGFRLFGGYQFNQNVAVEGGYMDMGRVNFTTNVSAPVALQVSGTVKATNIWNLDVVPSIPLGDQGFSLYGRLGLAYTKMELSVSALGATISNSENKTVAHFGIGARYDFTPNFGIRGEWSRLNKVGSNSNTVETNVDFIGVDAIFSFQ